MADPAQGSTASGAAPPAAEAAVRRLMQSAGGRAVFGLVGVAAALALWQLAAATGFVSEARVSKPSAVLPRVGELVGSGEFRTQFIRTMAAWGSSMGLMIAVAVPVGLLIGSFRALREPTTGLVHVFRSIPATALIPVAILLFGLGLQMKMAVICYAISWPILLNAMYGAQSVDPQMRAVARALRLDRWRVFMKVTLPAATRYIGTGVRLAGGIAFVVVIGTELLGAGQGVGTLIVRFQRLERPDLAFAGILLVGIAGVVVYQVLSTAERRLAPWSPEHRRV